LGNSYFSLTNDDWKLRNDVKNPENPSIGDIGVQANSRAISVSAFSARFQARKSKF
jgi:hypothetical protein